MNERPNDDDDIQDHQRLIKSIQSESQLSTSNKLTLEQFNGKFNKNKKKNKEISLFFLLFN